MYPIFFNFTQKNLLQNKLETLCLTKFSNIFQIFFLDFLLNQFIIFSETIEYNSENFLLKNIYKNVDLLNTIFSNSFSYTFFSQLNS